MMVRSSPRFSGGLFLILECSIPSNGRRKLLESLIERLYTPERAKKVVGKSYREALYSRTGGKNCRKVL